MHVLRRLLSTAITLSLICVGSLALGANATSPQLDTVFQNVRIFDGRHGTLSAPSNVLVIGNRIEKISTQPIATESPTNIIEGNGRTLMPGLIDNHWHTMLVGPSMPQAIAGDLSYLSVLGVVEARAALMRGFTTVRDMGGPSFALKRAIDEGVIEGPRIYPSGAMITITGGHGDFRSPGDLPRNPGGELTMMEKMNGSQLADSPDEVRLRTREQLLLGASQIKLTAGGGVASPHSPLDVSTFTVAELEAAVEAAGNWGTYVGVHAYTPAAIQRAIKAGVKVIEHGHLMDEASAKLIAEKGIWLSFQPFVDDGHTPQMPPSSIARMQQVMAGTERTVALAKKYNMKMAWGTDVLFSSANATRQGALLVLMQKWYTPAQVLTMATGTNAELLALSGPRNPYPGKLGVVEEGALADLLLINGNPLENLSLLENPDRYIDVIMKDGTIYKFGVSTPHPDEPVHDAVE